MKESLKKLLAGILIFTFLVCMIPLPATAATHNGDKIGTMQMTHVNPLEKDLISEEDLLDADLWMEFDHPDLYAEATEDEILCYYSVEDTAIHLREAMEERQEVVEVGYITENLDELTEEGFMDYILVLSLLHTGEPTEGDYIFWQLGEAAGQGTIYEIEEGYAAIMTFQMSYYTTYEQEQELTKAIDEFLDSYYESYNRADYYLLRTAYKYICDNITYDYDNLNDSDYKLKHTAYAAMIDGTAVCQGYALLLYRLALELGIDCRLIPGYSGDETHGWNIIQMSDGYYYNADATWDAGNDDYEYFLVSDENFEDHERDEEYASADFYEVYPMGSSDYPLETPVELEGQYHYKISDGEAHITAYLFDSTTPTVPKKLDAHPVVSIGDGVYEGKILEEITIPANIEMIGESAFASCANLTEIYFEGEVPAISETAFAGTTATAYYPNGFETWTEDVLQNYGGSLTWVSYCLDNNHNYVLVETVEATCTQAGSETYSCSNCGKTNTKAITAKGHDWVDVTIEPGHTERTCNTCGVIETDISYDWFEYEGDWYYRNAEGELVKGWLYDRGGWFYLDEDGKMVTGWLKDGEKTYYMDSAGRMKTGWLLYEDNWYYFTAGGELKTGWLYNNTIWYYMDEDGKMHIGWLNLEDGRYYMDSTGGMKTGWLKYNDQWYYFDESGVLATDEWVGDSYVDENGVWIQDKVKE